MRDLTPSSPKPGSALRRSGHNATLLTGLIALFAMVVIGVSAPNFADSAHGSNAATPPAAGADAGVPAAADAFAEKAPSGDTFTPQAPTF